MIAVSLALSWFAIERLHSVQVTVFQPFRMATVARGIALVLVSGRILALWRTGEWLSRMRAILLAVAITGDWLMVVVTVAELAVSAAEAIGAKLAERLAVADDIPRFFTVTVWFGTLALGLNFLGHHDTEYGHLPLLAAIGVGVLAAVPFLFQRTIQDDPTSRLAALASACPRLTRA